MSALVGLNAHASGGLVVQMAVRGEANNTRCKGGGKSTGTVYGSPKTGRSRRTVPLPTRSVKVLRAHRARQAAEALVLGPQWRIPAWYSPRRSGR